MKKIKSARLTELRSLLKYWQERTRIDAKSLQGSRTKVKRIAIEMRKIQAEAYKK